MDFLEVKAVHSAKDIRRALSLAEFLPNNGPEADSCMNYAV